MSYLIPKSENGREYKDRLRGEIYDHLDPRLLAILLASAVWFWREFGKKLTYTCVNRTEAENKLVGGVKYSAHLYGRAVDLRVHNLTEDEIKALIEYIDQNWQKERQWLYILVHGAGHNKHMHINIQRRFSHGSFV